MDIHNLVTMANRIGDFYESMPDEQEAKHDIANHIVKFWEPRMRKALLAQIEGEGTRGLHALVKAAVVEHRGVLVTW